MGCMNIKKYDTVENINIKKFMGEWYVIASVPTFLDKDAVNPIETYIYNDKGYIDTKFTFYKDSFNSKKKMYHSKAFIKDDKKKSEWKMQFFWPLRFSYLIIDLADDYSYTVISVPNKKYIWIMARTSKLDEKIYNNILKNLERKKYDISKIQKSIHI